MIIIDDSPFNSLSKNHDGNSFIQYNEDYRKNEIEEQVCTPSIFAIHFLIKLFDYAVARNEQ